MADPVQDQQPAAATKVAFKIEVAAASGGGLRPEMSPDRFLNATQETLRGIADIIEESCAAFVERLNTMNAKPKECAIEFGVNAGGEAGVPFVAKGTLGANFKVSLKWSWS
jgi:Trypsin-co-occurring domain 1